MNAFQLFGALSKVEDQDDGTIRVHGIASTGARDAAGEIITPEAMKAALPAYLQWGAVREMHGPSAAGTAVECDVDAEGITRFVAHVVDEAAIKKVRSKVYKGFSVGGKVKKRDPADRTIITEIDLIEVSLVDRPCNPEAVIDLWKADINQENEGMSDQTGADAAYSPTSAETKELAASLAKAAGKPDRPQDFLVKARAELIERGAPAPVAEPVAAPDGGTQVAEPLVEKADPAAALTEALERAAAVIAEPVTAGEPAQVTPGLLDFGKALVALNDKALAKGLWSVGYLARVIEEVADIQMMSAWEAQSEGDGSAVPQQLADAIRQLGATLINMANEEVAELIESMKDGGADIEVIVIDDDDGLACAAKVVDAVKADTALMEKAGKRNSARDQKHIQDAHDSAMKAGAKCDGDNVEKAADADDLAKTAAERDRYADALEKAVPAIDDLKKHIAGEGDRTAKAIEAALEKFRKEPLPPKTAGSAYAVEKAADSAGNAAPSAETSAESIEKALAAMTPEDRAHLLMKAALARPIAIRA